MTQSEFELQLLDLKQKQAKEIGTIEKMQQQVKEELAAKKRTVHGINEDCAKLRQELSLLHKRHLELSAKWGGADYCLHQRAPGSTNLQPRRSGHAQHHL